MELLYRSCCGIDVHKKVLVACIADGKRRETRSYGTTTREIDELADWIVESNATMVAMESTASYWKPLYNVLEERGLSAIVVNPAHMKNVPGRKTDVKDAEWICDLLQHGLLTASYIPSRSQRELRETLVYRRSLVEERAAEMNRYQKMLEGANIKLSGTVSNINGKSARFMMEKIIDGKFLTEEDIVGYIKDGDISGRMKASPKEIADSLNGSLSLGQRRNVKDVLAHYDDLTARISSLEDRVRSSLSEEQRHAVDLLTTIPGVGEVNAISIISVIGTDMTQFKSADHLCSWAGVCPGNNESAGKKRHSHCTKGNALLRYSLIQAASCATKTKDTFFSAKYSKILVRRGKNRAKVAVAHAMLVSIYNMLSRDTSFIDLGGDYYQKRNEREEKRKLVAKIRKLGLSQEELAALLK